MAAVAAARLGGHDPALVLAALAFLPIAYAALATMLAVRAAVLPVTQRHRAGTPRPLRPVQVGVIEMIAAAAVVLLAFIAPSA